MGMRDEKLAAAFGARLRELRIAAGLTQADLAARTDPPMQDKAIARYEAGDRGPTLALVYRLAEALGLGPAELLPPADSTPAKGGRLRKAKEK